MSCAAPTDRLLQTVIVTVPGITEDLVSLQLFNTIDEFLRRTSAWKYETEIVLEENILNYSYALPPDAEFVRMLGVTLNGTPVPPVDQPGVSVSAIGRISADLTFPDGDAQFYPDATDLASGMFSYVVLKPEYISVTRPPDATMVQHPLKAWMALTIVKRCLEEKCSDWQLEEWMYDMWFEPWLNGTLSRLFAMPSKPWTSATNAVLHGKRYRSQMASIKQEAQKGFVYNQPGWRFPRTGGWLR